jgi:hypothetical protein
MVLNRREKMQRSILKTAEGETNEALAISLRNFSVISCGKNFLRFKSKLKVAGGITNQLAM